MKLRISHSPRMRWKQFEFGCDHSVTKGTLHGEEGTFRLYPSFHWRDFPKAPHLVLSKHSLHAKQISSQSVNN
jgi:hypothetical protein